MSSMGGDVDDDEGVTAPLAAAATAAAVMSGLAPAAFRLKLDASTTEFESNLTAAGLQMGLRPPPTATLFMLEAASK